MREGKSGRSLMFVVLKCENTTRAATSQTIARLFSSLSLLPTTHISYPFIGDRKRPSKRVVSYVSLQCFFLSFFPTMYNMSPSMMKPQTAVFN